jgi:hypothetical protein
VDLLRGGGSRPVTDREISRASYHGCVIPGFYAKTNHGHAFLPSASSSPSRLEKVEKSK